MNTISRLDIQVVGRQDLELVAYIVLYPSVFNIYFRGNLQINIRNSVKNYSWKINEWCLKIMQNYALRFLRLSQGHKNNLVDNFIIKLNFIIIIIKN